MLSNFLSWLRKSYIAIIICIIYIPLIVLVIWSFAADSPKGNITTGFEWDGFNNYIKLFQNNEFLNGLMNSIIIAGITTPIAVSIATITCYAIWNTTIMQNTTNTMARISLVNPEIITGISLTLLFAATWIPLGLNLGFFTIILSHISFTTPYALITIYPRMTKFKKNLLDASRDLGYSNFITFFKIVLPFLLTSIIGAIALVAAMSFDDFIITNLVRGRVPTLSTEMYLMAKGIKSWAVTFGSILIISFILFILIKYLIGRNKQKKIKQSFEDSIFRKKDIIWEKQN